MGHGKRNMGTFFYICAPEWIHGRAGGPAGPSGPTRQGLFYDSGWRNGSQPSLLLDHTAHPGHLPPSPAVPSPLLPERGYRTERLERKTINQSKSPKTSTKTPWAGCTLFNEALPLTDGVDLLCDQERLSSHSGCCGRRLGPRMAPTHNNDIILLSSKVTGPSGNLYQETPQGGKLVWKHVRRTPGEGRIQSRMALKFT